MKKFPLRMLVSALLAGCLLTSCKEKVDLSDIDTKSELEMGIALPIGSMSATLGDFLGNGQVQNIYIDSLHSERVCVITWKDTFDITRDFHPMDLTKYFQETRKTLDVYEQLTPIASSNDREIVGDGQPRTMSFPFVLKLSINCPASLPNERFDIADIKLASFSSTINKSNLPFNWEWIDKISLRLGSQFERTGGNVVTVYDKNKDSYGYGQTIDVDVDNFVLNLMKNKNVPGESVDTCNFSIDFTFTVPSGKTVSVPKGGGFDYKLGVKFINFRALWGKFRASNKMHDEEVNDIRDSWASIDKIADWCTPFTEPKIDMFVYTQVAGALWMNGDYLFVQDFNGHKEYATFKYGASDIRHDYKKQWWPGEYLDPFDSEPGDSTTNLVVPFDKDETRGHLDNLFKTMPEKIGYKFQIDFNYDLTPQIRLTPNTYVHVKAVCTVPLRFNKDVFIRYDDTIRDVKLSKYSIDSLLASVNIVDTMKTTDVKLVLHAENTIPLDVRASMRCWDANNNLIMDPADPKKPLMLFKQDTVHFAACQDDYGKEPGKTTIVASVSKREMDLLPKIDHITYTAFIDDRSLKDAYDKKLLNNVAVRSFQGLKVKIGLAAKVDAVFDFNNKDNQ